MVGNDGNYIVSDCSRPSSPGGSTWLQSQQTKLRERQEARVRMARSPHEERLMSELKSVQTKRMLDTGTAQDLSTPLHVHTSSSSSPGVHPGTVSENGGSSAYGSPFLSTPTRSSSRQRTAHYQLQRNKSDTSFDRDRPFVSVKRAHEESKRYIEVSHRILFHLLLVCKFGKPSESRWKLGFSL